MKKRNFYPRQVLRALEGKTVQELDAGRMCALQFFMRKSRKMNQMIAVLSDAKQSAVAGATEAEAHAVFANATTRIFLTLPNAA